MKSVEQRKAAKDFISHWTGRGGEKQDCQSYWSEMLAKVFGIDAPSMYVAFEKPLPKGFIDAYIPETKVLIEQKGLGISLDAKEPRQGKMVTPYEQARDYVSQLSFDEKPRYIITCNFSTIRVYDTKNAASYDRKTDTWSAPYEEIQLADLETDYSRLSFLVDEHEQRIKKEMELSLQAGELVGKIHDRFLEQYHDPMAKKTQNSLNILCVRIVFCLYAEDAGLFGEKEAFSKYIEGYEPKDIRRALLDLFKVLDTPEDQREDMYLDDELAAFPYVNGGLFARENIEIPKITQEIKDTILESAEFNWSEISPTIFGAVFESTLNPETRRKGGMHYTSIENIHKVIDPLFLDDLKTELKEIRQISVVKTRRQKLEAFQRKLASLRFLDPAAGSGNFLTESYLSLRRLENEVIQDLNSGQMTFGDMKNPIQVSIQQFYGIEINDFAVTVAKTALWIAESQMFTETEDILYQHMDFLPLKTNANIIEGNALQLNWERVVPKAQLSYIMGNPPFIGYSLQSSLQKNDIVSLYVDENGTPYRSSGKLDYVSGWYFKAAHYIQNTHIKCAFVSTNSICQGEQAANLWKPICNRFGIHITFAYTTFIWDSEASEKAHVHVVIVGFSCDNPIIKYLFDGETGKSTEVNNINCYLFESPDVFIENRTKAICNLPEISKGFQATDNGYLILDSEARSKILNADPEVEKYIRPYSMGAEFINGIDRYCLWLSQITPQEIRRHPLIKKRIELCQKWRETQSKSGDAYKLKDMPHLFRPCKQFKDAEYIAIPLVSSGRRRYVPMGFIDNGMIPGNNLFAVFDAHLYHFGILESNVHMAWMRTFGGRLKSDYRYSIGIVYNTFPWPSPTDVQKQKIEQTAQAILDARALYPDSSLADLYDPLTMPPELRKAHAANDMAVMAAYGFVKGSPEYSSESACVAALMKLYQTKVSEQNK